MRVGSFKIISGHGLLRHVHALDPSRILVLKSGNQYWNQAFMLPYDDTIYHEDGKRHSGWSDSHEGTPEPGTWTDDLYVDPLHYHHDTTDLPEITMWGEEMGTGVSDNHEEIVKELNGATAYDSAWHIENGFPELDQLLPRVKEGARLVFWPEHFAGTVRFAQALAQHGFFTFKGSAVGNSIAWMNCWYFVRQHWLFDGLPTNCVMAKGYQVRASNDCGGLDLEGDNIDTMVGFDANGSATIHLRSSLVKDNEAVTRPVARRLLMNALFGK